MKSCHSSEYLMKLPDAVLTRDYSFEKRWMFAFECGGDVCVCVHLHASNHFRTTEKFLYLVMGKKQFFLGLVQTF